jgi:GAF domain-containing protein
MIKKSFESNDKKFIGYVESEKVESLSNWLKEGFKTQNFCPFVLHNDSSAAVQLTHLFHQLDIKQQDKFKSATTQAIASKELYINNALALEGLVVLASYIRAYSVIEILESILKNQWSGNAIEANYEEAVEKIISVLSGFAKSFAKSDVSRNIEDFFKELFFGNFDHRYAVQLFIGLCICDDEKYPTYLKQLFKLDQEHPGTYKLDLVIETFVNVVSQDVLRKKINKLDSVYQDKLKNFPCASFIFEGAVTAPLNWLEEVKSIKKELMPFREDKEGLIQVSLRIVRRKLSSQVASIYLFSKEGYLYRAGIDGVDSEGNPIENWFEDEHYRVGDAHEGFIAEAAKPDPEDKLGRSQFPDSFSEEQLSRKSWEKYSRKLGRLNCGISIPLDGRNRTYGVLAIMNKVDERTGKPLNSCTFSMSEYFWLSEISSLIATAISNFRRGLQDKFENDLAKLLVGSSFQQEQKEAVYQQVVQRLTSENTAFKACVLRIKNEKGELEVSKEYIFASNEEERKKLLKDRVKEVIKPGTGGTPGWVAQRLKHKTFPIDESNIGDFFVNEEWVRKNQFKSYGCFPLIAGDKLVGTLSLYVAYNYDFHPSCIDFLERLTTLLASFILRVNESQKIDRISQMIHSILDSEKVRSKQFSERGEPERKALQDQQITKIYQLDLDNVEKDLVSMRIMDAEAYHKYD